MITSLYAALSALLITYMSIYVVKKRRKHKVAYDDGGVEELNLARAAQSCCTEYLPISLILLLALELSAQDLNALVLHGLGLTLVLSRAAHVRSLLKQDLKLRSISMHITVYTIFGLAILNIAYFFIQKIS